MSSVSVAFYAESNNKNKRDQTRELSRLSDLLLLEVREILDSNTSPSAARNALVERMRIEDRPAKLLMSDIVKSVANALAELVAFKRLGAKPICLQSSNGESSLVSLNALVPTLFRDISRENFLENLIGSKSRLIDRFLQLVDRTSRGYEEFSRLDVPDAADALRAGISTFILVQSGYLESQAGSFGPGPPGPGCPLPWDGGLSVRVNCRTGELRLHYSPAYFIDWKVFGDSLSSPVIGQLPPGRYKFGFDHLGGQQILSDDGIFEIPPTYDANLTRC